MGCILKRKQGLFQIKAIGDKGEGTAVFATLNVVDKDGDLAPPGAFGTQMAKLVGAHDWSAPSIGSARVYESADSALADFRFNLDMPSAEEWYKSLKFNYEAGIVQEFSYGYDVLSSRFEEREGRQIRILEKLKVHEVSPVMLGAGVNTRLVTMKSTNRTMDEQWLDVEEVVVEFIERCKALAALRGKEGRTLSRATRDRLTRLAADITRLLEESDAQNLVIPEADGKTVNLALLDVELIEAELMRRAGG